MVYIQIHWMNVCIFKCVDGDEACTWLCWGTSANWVARDCRSIFVFLYLCICDFVYLSVFDTRKYTWSGWGTSVNWRRIELPGLEKKQQQLGFPDIWEGRCIALHIFIFISVSFQIIVRFVSFVRSSSVYSSLIQNSVCSKPHFHIFSRSIQHQCNVSHSGSLLQYQCKLSWV